MKFEKLGIDLGKNSIRIITLEEQDDLSGVVVSDFEEYFVSYENKEEYLKELNLAIKDFSKKINKKLISLNFTIPYDSPLMITNFLTVPNIDLKLLNKTIDNEMQVIREENMNDYINKWELLSENEDEETMDIISIAIKKDIVESLDDLGKIIWRVDRIEPQIYTASKIIKGDVAFIDAGLNNIIIYSYKDGILVDISVIKNKHESLILENEASIDDKIRHIMKLKKINSCNENMEAITIANNTAEIVDDIKNEIRRIEVEKLLPFNEIYLMGGLTNIDGFANVLENSLHIKTTLLNIGKISEYIAGEKENNQLEDDALNNEDEVEINLEGIEIMGLDNEDDIDNNLNSDEDSFNDESTSLDETSPKEVVSKYNCNSLLFTERNKEVEKLSFECKDIVFEESPFGDEGSYIYSILVLLKNEENLFNFSNQKMISINTKALMMGFLTATLVLNLGFVGVSKQYDKNIEQSNSELSKVVSVKDNVTNRNEALLSSIEDHRSIIDQVNALKDQKKWLSDMLYTLSKETPKYVTIEDVGIIHEEVTVSGYAKDYKNIGFLAIALEQYGDIDIHEVDILPDRDIKIGDVQLTKQFKITLNHDGSINNKDELLLTSKDKKVDKKKETNKTTKDKSNEKSNEKSDKKANKKANNKEG